MVLTSNTIILLLLALFGIILMYLLVKRYGLPKSLIYVAILLLFVIVFLEGLKCIIIDSVAKYESTNKKVIFLKNSNDDCRIDNLSVLLDSNSSQNKVLLLYVTLPPNKKIPHLISCINNKIIDKNKIINDGDCDIFHLDVNRSSGYIKPIKPLATINIKNKKIISTISYSENLWDKYILIRAGEEYCKVFLNESIKIGKEK